jgi:actin-related protein
MACDVDVRASLLQNIVVVGNASFTKGMIERLDVELAGLMPSVSETLFSEVYVCDNVRVVILRLGELLGVGVDRSRGSSGTHDEEP